MTSQGELLPSCMFARNFRQITCNSESTTITEDNNYQMCDAEHQTSITIPSGATISWPSNVITENVGSRGENRVNNTSKTQKKFKRVKRSVAHYKHVPHREKPPQIVARRNARERRRVQAVNSAFSRLRKVVPIENSRGKRVSKVKTLHGAIDYIRQLQNLLLQSEIQQVITLDINKENTKHHWNIIDNAISLKWNPSGNLSQYLEEFSEEFY